MVSPKRNDWRCSNCGEVANEVDEASRFDPRYTTGHCGNCKLRSPVPLVFSSFAEMQVIIAERADKVLRGKQMNGIEVGIIAAHPKTSGCCADGKKREHLSAERVDQLLALMGARA